MKPLTPMELLEAYASGVLSVPGGREERGLLEARLGVLHGHLERLAALPRGERLRVEAVGGYALALSRGVGECLRLVERRLASRRERGLLWVDALRLLRGPSVSCSFQLHGAVAGVDVDSGLLFVHPLPPIQAALLAAAMEAGGLSEGLVRAAMGFRLHRWEPGAGTPVEGLRVRLQGDIVLEYAAVYGGRGEALEAAGAYEAFQRGVEAGVERAVEAFAEIAEILAARLRGGGDPWRLLEEVLDEWLGGSTAPPGVGAEAGRNAVRRPGWAPLRLQLRFNVEARLDPEECRLSRWRGLRGSPGCALLALYAASGVMLTLASPVGLGSRPVVLSMHDFHGKQLAAAYAAAASRLTPGHVRPRKLVVQLGDHNVVAEEAVAVDASEAARLHGIARAASLLAQALDAIEASEGSGLPVEAVEPLLELLALDTPSHVMVLTRPQRLVVEHPEHGRASIDIDAPAALLPGSLKTATL